MRPLTRSAILFAVSTLVLSCSSGPSQEENVSSRSSETSAQQNRYVGRWEATVEGVTASLVLRESHKCVFTIPDGTAEGTWSVSGENLTVNIPDTDSIGGETFYGLFNPQGDELEIWEEGSEHVILKRVDESP